MVCKMLAAFSVSVLPVLVAAQSTAASPPPLAYAVPGVFPTSVYGAYYNDPTATTAEPQPIITDPVTVSILPLVSSPSSCSCVTSARSLSALADEPRHDPKGKHPFAPPRHLSPMCCLA